jgi:hypothetical protein
VKTNELILSVRLALEEGDVSVFLESEEEEPRLTSSLLTIPTYIKVSIACSPSPFTSRCVACSPPPTHIKVSVLLTVST